MLIVSLDVVPVGKMLQNVVSSNVARKLSLHEKMGLFKLIELHEVFCNGMA